METTDSTDRAVKPPLASHMQVPHSLFAGLATVAVEVEHIMAGGPQVFSVQDLDCFGDRVQASPILRELRDI